MVLSPLYALCNKERAQRAERSRKIERAERGTERLRKRKERAYLLKSTTRAKSTERRSPSWLSLRERDHHHEITTARSHHDKLRQQPPPPRAQTTTAGSKRDRDRFGDWVISLSPIKVQTTTTTKVQTTTMKVQTTITDRSHILHIYCHITMFIIYKSY